MQKPRIIAISSVVTLMTSISVLEQATRKPELLNAAIGTALGCLAVAGIIVALRIVNTLVGPTVLNARGIHASLRYIVTHPLRF